MYQCLLATVTRHNDAFPGISQHLSVDSPNCTPTLNQDNHRVFLPPYNIDEKIIITIVLLLTIKIGFHYYCLITLQDILFYSL